MKMIFLLENDYNQFFLTGMRKKVEMQKDLFVHNGIDCKIIIMDEDVYQFSLLAKILKRIPLTNVSPRWKYKNELGLCDWVYFRRPFYMNVHTIFLLSKIKRKNVDTKIIMEIPTFPYDGEYKFIDIPLMIKDRVCRRFIRNYVDRLAVVGSPAYVPNKLWGIDVIHFENGIDVEKIKVKPCEKKDDSINMIAISSMAPWHGYERVIAGLTQYYKNLGKENINIYFIGDGKERRYYEKISSNLYVKDKIHFLGFLTGDDLETAIEKYGDIGLCSFGRYKTKMPHSTDLKSIEYLSHGIPVITGASLDYNGIENFCLEFANDNSIVDINRILIFYHNLVDKYSEEGLAEKVREYAKENCDISKTMKPIIEAIWGNYENG